MNDEQALDKWENYLLNDYFNEETKTSEEIIEEKWAYEEDFMEE